VSLFNSNLTANLSKANRLVFSVYAIVAAFSTYFCMYAFRKPVAATGYEDILLWGMGIKTVFIISQTIGYTISKFSGIKVISEMKGSKRGASILALIGFAELMLLGFAIVPNGIKPGFIFMNGLALGLIWGLVFSFLEGRTNTELLGAGLSVSFVVASGWTKSAGVYFMSIGVPEFWMPFVTGLAFALPLILSVWMLGHIPPPSAEDETARTKRAPMDGKARMQFFKTFSIGIVLLVLIYMMLTAFRDFRDNFMADILTEHMDAISIDFGTIETYVAFALLTIVGSIMLIKNNLTAFIVNHVLIIGGFLMVGLATWLFQEELIDPNLWMILTGIGGYMGYIPFNCLLFERLIATFRYVSNAGFLIYVADAFGYTAAIGIMLYKDSFDLNGSWTDFFADASWLMMIVGTILTIASLIYFVNKKRNWSPAKVQS
jgi:MFS family permease